HVSSPIGPITIVAAGGAVVAIRFGSPDDVAGSSRDGAPDSPHEADDGSAAVDGATAGALAGRERPADRAVLAEAARQLDEYFAGARRAFDLSLAPDGTAFQRRVWDRLLQVEHGTTCTYLDIAMDVGGPTAVRAVGTANGANPIPIVVPCHRVIGSDGTLVGYAGGLDRKRWLLDHEAGVQSLFAP
ncbi:MAG TPA: methylated-DNA--[protein]-cysteine S-methyltransferase, partial [Nitriliruptoraceae bacterium]|nr:methylated-DNA--[protein]-cysteine S-methyltransferase [Nitriliruptoraceae bacterium]